MKTTIVSTIDRKTHQIDATGKTIGRLATQIAILLRGKHKVGYTPHIDNGDFVEVMHVDKVAFTGKKIGQKVYKHYTGYPGGLKTVKAEHLFEKNPGEVLKKSVLQMLAKNKQRADFMKRLIIK